MRFHKTGIPASLLFYLPETGKDQRGDLERSSVHFPSNKDAQRQATLHLASLEQHLEQCTQKRISLRKTLETATPPTNMASGGHHHIMDTILHGATHRILEFPKALNQRRNVPHSSWLW